MGIASNSIARLVDGLVGRGLVSKRVSEADARTRLLNLTGQGRKFLSLLEPHNAQYESEVIEGFGKDRHDALCALLRPFVGAGPVEELDRF